MIELASPLDPAACSRAFNRQDAEGCRKTAEDLARYRVILANTEPQLIIETGTFQGGSALWFAERGYDVVSIDTESSTAKPEARDHPLIHLLHGDSVLLAPEVEKRLGGMRTMVVLDSDHTAGHVQAEIEAYAPLVSPGCYLVVEDGICDWMGMAPGPLTAIMGTLALWDGWERDEEIEGMFPASMFVAGWWRKEE